MKMKAIVTIVLMTVLFNLTFVNNSSAVGPVVIDNWTSDYQFGYQEGVNYAQMDYWTGYDYMLNHYIAMRELYGDDNINYTARIEGLKDGWIDGSSNQLPIQSMVISPLCWSTLQMNIV